MSSTYTRLNRSSVDVSRGVLDEPSNRLSKKADDDSTSLGLTDRQMEVLGLMVRGKSNRDIASLLGLSEGTVKIHLSRIFKRLGVSSRTQAMLAVAKRGIRFD